MLLLHLKSLFFKKLSTFHTLGDRKSQLHVNIAVSWGMTLSFHNLANLLTVFVIGKNYAVYGLGTVEKVYLGVRGINS
jgi:hypothetical protein